ncbi:hypothetical protein OG607_30385 [Streptomyces sp. NBC_01537]|uniref:hypothetical protein n=1 Tax=Streptomyces sp. NBC_01537 TaxID=2903896 RepID=UPI003864D669
MAIRGWLECDREQLAAVKAIIESHDDDRYSGGWGFPARPFNWTSYAFYGGDIREACVPWLFDQLVAIAGLPASDEDGDRVQGLFMATHEMTGLAEWQIRDGAVHVLPGGHRHQYLDPP